jgi:CspA family cold shock protein
LASIKKKNYVENSSLPIKNSVLSADIIATKVTGKVKLFNDQKGLGFITRTDTDEDIFVSRIEIFPARSLNEGEYVQFDIKMGPKGEQAFNVSILDGAHVKSNMSSSDKIIAKSETQKKEGVGKENATQSKAILDCAPEKSNLSSTDEIIAAKVTGTVKRFNNKKGRGTITCTDTEKDIFVRRSSILPAKILLVGEVVQFEIKEGEACNVTGGLDGAPLKDRKALYWKNENKEELTDTKEKISGSGTSYFETWFKKQTPKSAKKKPV